LESTGEDLDEEEMRSEESLSGGESLVHDFLVRRRVLDGMNEGVGGAEDDEWKSRGKVRSRSSRCGRE